MTGYIRVGFHNFAWEDTEHYFNTQAYHAAGVSRRQFKKFKKMFKKVNTLEVDEHIWNHHENCIQKSTNMPGIGSLIREINVKSSEM